MQPGPDPHQPVGNHPEPALAQQVAPLLGVLLAECPVGDGARVGVVRRGGFGRGVQLGVNRRPFDPEQCGELVLHPLAQRRLLGVGAPREPFRQSWQLPHDLLGERGFALPAGRLDTERAAGTVPDVPRCRPIVDGRVVDRGLNH
ncbi:hypothetical protein [Micromonospora arborensis]|uniref:hypothetical protein n=1 Tax=Micromonospora arborensis TaxID=2116518 RepID=UPI0011B4A669|nr:hypothetical protein [Micromonospora arborensis]